jgi:hypothetical protein
MAGLRRDFTSMTMPAKNVSEKIAIEGRTKYPHGT